MKQLQGYWFDGKTSAGVAAEVQVDGAGHVRALHAGDGGLLQECNFSALRVSSRVGNTPRYLYFSSGEKFETSDNSTVDQLLLQHRPSLLNTLAYQLESHIYFVFLTLILVVVFSWAGVKYGLPAASKAIAYRLPPEVMNRAAVETLKLLDKTHLQPTRLEQPLQDRLLAHFAEALTQNEDLHLQVLFREGGKMGANAFALPDGTIIFTDEMVKLARSDDELLAVLAHEIGHIKYRHSLRSAIQGTSVGFMVSMLTGDLSAASGALAALPVILTTMSYSRDFEREADQNALDYLTEHHIDPLNFVTLMERVTYEYRCEKLLKITDGENWLAKQKTTLGENKPEVEGNVHVEDPALTSERAAARKAQCDKLIEEDKAGEAGLMDYFSTHPATEERLQKFRHLH